MHDVWREKFQKGSELFFFFPDGCLRLESLCLITEHLLLILDYNAPLLQTLIKLRSEVQHSLCFCKNAQRSGCKMLHASLLCFPFEPFAHEIIVSSLFSEIIPPETFKKAFPEQIGF